METSDSEYFESADEDFESEDEFNKNKILVKDNSVHTSNFSKDVNKIHTVSDLNRNKKESVDTLNVNQDNKLNLQGSDIGNNPIIEDHKIETPVLLAKSDRLLTTNKKDDKQINQADLSSDAGRNLQDNAEDNLWNEGEGWGVSDESDTEGAAPCLQKVDVGITLPNNDKNSNKKEVSGETSVGTSNMWDNEEWENWESIKEEKMHHNNIKPDEDNNSSNSNQIWKGWGNWGVTSILSTATQGVSSLTNSVSQGLSSVLETGIGAPDPEKLAVLNKEFKTKVSVSTETSSNTGEEFENKNVLGFGLSNIGNLVSGVSKLVESTGTKVISGGLDTLETIGKKTMEVIQDGDPGLKRKRAFLNLEGEKPVLSQVLREAKEKAEQENKALQEKHFARKVNYESIFDDHQGLVHLEALEMLSKQCDMKLQLLIESNSGDTLMDIQETVDQVKELCELPDEEEDEQISIEELKERLKSAVEEIGVNIKYDKLITMWEETESWLSNLNLNICNENEIHQQAVETLAQLTAIAVEQFHKAGELLLIKDHHSTADEADSLVQLTTTLTSLIGIVAAKFSDKMNTKSPENSDKENINSLITNIFFEAANSSSYIQDAFQLLVPVLQMGAV
ncbi:protein FAM114A2 [Anoplophora glabripennis]|uniref:protein FAM114A2 n=1 Tax=Anoplophora glabripennis TaxID=217634 RepID=UPI000874B08C|nr:protein FAM114A2 [Anoplophora glabripennis]